MIQDTNLYGLVQPLGGLIGKAVSFWAESDEPGMATRIVDLGDVSQVWGRPSINRKTQTAQLISGCGVGLDAENAFLPAVGEGLERYCSCVFAKEQFIAASARDLGGEALNLDLVARCSKTELANPKCPLLPPDKNTPIRWVRGLSLLDGRRVYLPAVMVYLYTGSCGPGERFWLPITTGCAGHISFERALSSAICEVVERDAISLVWLQKLALPRIEIDHAPPPLADYWARYLRASRDLEYIFFDATTDLGVPTVYGLQISRENQRLTTLVSCSTALQPAEAISKVMRDMAACRIAFRGPRPVPETPRDCRTVFDGASYMSPADRIHAFDFLLDNHNYKSLGGMAGLDRLSDQDALQRLLAIFRAKKMDIYAVDLSTDEALRVGMRVVRVVIPALQPFSFNYLARYLGHPRLYDAPREMGYRAYKETELNPWPQPFA
ncbi:MAG TPA: YcaO-like family protein [Candidatus Angelobacter sp.]|nr:YcaO-like family protein [Candidatus Angelobacter sp.]